MNKTKFNVFFRADGSHAIGLGHLFRVKALADMLKDTYTCHLVHKGLPNGIVEDFKKTFEKLHEIPVNNNLKEDATYLLDIVLKANNLTSSIIITDGYAFSYDYQMQIKKMNIPIICIDDIHQEEFCSDVIINHAPHVSTYYKGLTGSGKLLTGLDYAILRPAFLKLAQSERNIPITSLHSKIFLCFGGSDKENLTLPYSKLLLGIHQEATVHAVCGASMTSFEEMKKLANSTKKLFLYSNLNEIEMANLISSSSSAVVPSSTILYEVIAARKPVITGYFVENQERIYEGFTKKKIAYGIGNFLKPEKSIQKAFLDLQDSYREMIKLQEVALDGESRSRYLKTIKQLFNVSSNTN